jgi:protein-disulfide isomerase/uncharacterized membrane protein
MPGNNQKNSATHGTASFDLPQWIPASGLLFLILAALGAAMMSAKHIWSLSLPGCGPGAGCDWAIKSAWSNVLGLPVAFLGLAYFAASLAFRLATLRSSVSRLFLYAVRFGALVSVGFIIIMAGAGHICIWCLFVHASNLLWWGSLEFVASSSNSNAFTPPRAVVLAVAVFLGVASTAMIVESRYESIAATKAQADAAASIARIGLPQDLAGNSPASGPEESSSNSQSTTVASRRFGGRFWLGNPDADVRVVVFQDYQCELCREVEGILSSLLKSRSDVALSVKQWPFDKACNNQILGANLHPGACFAARCAEAAGLIGGSDTFWKIHYWLVEQGGRVDTTALKEELTSLGADWTHFRQALQSPLVDSIITNDIAQGVQLGLKYTPMVFVNGYQVEGWQTPGALPAAIDRAAQFAKQQPIRADQPELAIDRQFRQWESEPQQMMVIRNDDHIHGRIGAPTAILLYGDMSDPYNALAFHMLEPVMKDTSKVCVIFRSFPLQPECNDMVKRRINDRACEAAQAAEGASIVSGEPSFWAALKWLSDENGHYPKSIARGMAPAVKANESSLAAATSDSLVGFRIRENVESAKQLGIDTSPTIFVNGRILRDWRTPGLLDKVIRRAAELAAENARSVANQR